MKYIWYNPQVNGYQLGTEVDFNVEKANSRNPQEMFVLYELDELTERLANKIVKELNTARHEYKIA
jgi:hypothetical protein